MDSVEAQASLARSSRAFLAAETDHHLKVDQWMRVADRHDRTGNLPPLPGIFPDYGAPIVRERPD